MDLRKLKLDKEYFLYSGVRIWRLLILSLQFFLVWEKCILPEWTRNDLTWFHPTITEKGLSKLRAQLHFLIGIILHKPCTFLILEYINIKYILLNIIFERVYGRIKTLDMVVQSILKLFNLPGEGGGGWLVYVKRNCTLSESHVFL